jgi:hypothetical protein
VILLFLLTPVLPLVQGQTQYSIGLFYKVHVPSGHVGVVIPGNPKWAHDAVLEALGIWNQAQLWFLGEYLNHTGKIYNLTESSSGIRVEYLYQTCCSSTYPYNAGGALVKIAITNENNETYSALTVTTIAAHELGHALGLNHAKVEVDLMNPQVPIPSLPSTLDLYALSKLAGGFFAQYANTVVTLPSSIPYMTVPEEALPEFPNGIFLLLSVLFVVGVACRLRRLRLPRALAK